MSQNVDYNYNGLGDETGKVPRCGSIPLNGSEMISAPRGGYSQELNPDSAYGPAEGEKSVQLAVEAVEVEGRPPEVPEIGRAHV